MEKIAWVNRCVKVCPILLRPFRACWALATLTQGCSPWATIPRPCGATDSVFGLSSQGLLGFVNSHPGTLPCEFPSATRPAPAAIPDAQ